MHFKQTSQISQPPNIYILSPFLPPLLLPCILLNTHDCYQVNYPMYTLCPQNSIKSRSSPKVEQPKAPHICHSLLWWWTRASQGSPLLGLAWAVTRLWVISSSQDNLVWALCSPSGRRGFLNRPKNWCLPQAREHQRQNPTSFMLIKTLQCSYTFHISVPAILEQRAVWPWLAR